MGMESPISDRRDENSRSLWARLSSRAFGGLVRAIAAIALTLGAIGIGRQLGSSLTVVLGVALAVSTLFHLLGLFGGIKGLFGAGGASDDRLAELTDDLTGLANRPAVMSAIAAARRNATRTKTVMGVIFIDLNRFKAVNDTMGHAVGDKLLKVVAARLTKACRTGDVIGRFGGDEFVVVVHGLLEHDSIRRVATSIRDSFDEPIIIDGAQLSIGMSLGVTTAAIGDTRTSAEMLRDADTAMYTAKTGGLGVRVFNTDDRDTDDERMSVEEELIPALEEGQFKIFYQPIVSAKTGQLCAMEGLVRWQHPEQGLLAPARFLNILEEAGMSSRLGEYVLRDALTRLREWDAAHPEMANVSFNLNVSEHQLLDRGFPEQVAGALRIAGVEARRLTFEIAEDTMITRVSDSRSVLEDLAEMGISLVVDDFGTGRSPMAWIKQLDMIKGLKIDGSIVDGLPDDEIDIALIDATMLLAEALGVDVVAEGVETPEHVAELLELGIDNMQGYVFARPQKAEDIDIASLLRNPLAGAGLGSPQAAVPAG